MIHKISLIKRKSAYRDESPCSRVWRGRGGGVPTKIFYLCYLGTHAKIQNSTSLSRSYMRFSGQNRVIWGVGEVPQSYHLCYLEAHAKKWTPMMSLS